MKNKFMTVPFEVKEAEEDSNTGFLKGLASTFGNVDEGRDVVEFGAFKTTIAAKKGVFPMLLDHNPQKPAGYQKVRETEAGLEFEAEMKLYDPDVKQRYELAKLSLKMESPMGMSIGYRAIQEDYEELGGQLVRKLKELKLYEASLVVFPMNTEAMVSDAKYWNLFETESLNNAVNIFIDAMRQKGHTLEDVFSAVEIFRSATGKEDPGLSAQSLSETIKKIKEINATFGRAA